MQLLWCGSGWLPIVEMIRARLSPGDAIAIWDRSAPLATAVHDVDVLLPSNAAITPEVIAAAPRLRLIQQPAAGSEEIDRTAAAARGIPICNAPGANHVAVAEAALFHLLALARRAPAAARAFAAREIGTPLGTELAGKTLAVLGMGRSGQALAERARGLGMTVLGIGRMSRDDRLAQLAAADAISIHCPLTPETRGMIDRAAFAALRPGAFVVNVARGAVIDRAALLAALEHLGGVGLDVHWEEPWDPADPLYQHPKLFATPHIAGSTVEALSRIVDIVVDNTGRTARGEPLRHRIA